MAAPRCVATTSFREWRRRRSHPARAVLKLAGVTPLLRLCLKASSTRQEDSEGPTASSSTANPPQEAPWSASRPLACLKLGSPTCAPTCLHVKGRNTSSAVDHSTTSSPATDPKNRTTAKESGAKCGDAEGKATVSRACTCEELTKRRQDHSRHLLSSKTKPRKAAATSLRRRARAREIVEDLEAA
jgi:hypothetical protein